MKSPGHNHRAKRSRWDHINSPAGLRRRSAKADAEREAICATLPPAYAGPEPSSVWLEVLVTDGAGQIMHRATLYVPPEGASARCDQHPTVVDGKRCVQMQTATDIGALVRGWIYKRPSVAMVAEIRRDTWREAVRVSQGSPEHAA